MSNETDKKVADYLQSIGATYAVKHAGETTRDDGKWKCDACTVGREREEQMHLKPSAPVAAAVIYRLVMDSAAVDTSFKYWCDEYGYSSDSLSAFDTYRACCEIGEKMRRLFSGDEMSALRDMLQDY